MIIVVNQNSFVSFEDAQSYFEERYDSQKWFDASEEDRMRALVTATKKICTFDFIGEKKELSQPLEFPRKFGTPQDIKDATCEEAISILDSDANLHKKNQENNISSISLGAGSVSYNNSNNDKMKIMNSENAVRILQKWLKKGYALN